MTLSILTLSIMTLSITTFIITTGVEKINNNSLYIRILTIRCHKVRVNFGVLTMVNIFQSVLFH
jgi:hypothetical protein